MSIVITGSERSVEFGVTTLPYRKSKCLYRMRGAMLEPLAYFRTDQDAEIFEGILDFILETFQAAFPKSPAHEAEGEGE